MEVSSPASRHKLTDIQKPDLRFSNKSAENSNNK